MNKTMATADRALSFDNTNQTLNAGFPSNLLDLYSDAMDQALGIEKASLSAMVEVNSCALETYEQLVGALFGTVVRTFASCLQVQLSWLTLIVPRVHEGARALPNVAAPAAGISIDHGMDVVIGAGTGNSLPDMTSSIAPAGLTEPPEAAESCTDLAVA